MMRLLDHPNVITLHYFFYSTRKGYKVLSLFCLCVVVVIVVIACLVVLVVVHYITLELFRVA